MSNIDKQALREIAAAAVGAHERLSVMPPDDIFDISLAEGTQLDADITALNALNSAANPATVLALLDELESKDRRNAELEAKLANPVLLPKTNGYWTEQEKAYEDAITLAKRQIRLAGFSVEDM
ncbi:ead/Ea22-like family protein [Escherichia coli]|nr:ead/Ea22-like family protein [Escherichia coli]